MRLLFIGLSILLLLSGGMTSGFDPVSVQAEKDTPSYAKWGRLAMQETQSRYPDADIIDYLHRGREDKNTTSVEKFKLWLQEDEREFGVFIDIEFHTETEELIDITFREISR
ncbi:DUF3889 domain-containing protein [Lentibacillus sp.]|uniref:DUF3889 domain-containing protein n=1 Tax=Lentibacillus sp. TaxID=1925746 RepID=UPI002B4B40A1|nr:DUF3889 domain-containing protein [Lentibacillus sp.]HLS09640.1 DUF3889 domain-containing protein [Lentibacillus sp.]